MKISKIGDLNFGKFTTEIYVDEDVKKKFKSEKISLAVLIPTAWLWYDSELLELIDENGDGKPDERFGKKFRIIYTFKFEDIKEMEREALSISKTTIKNINLNYITLKNA